MSGLRRESVKRDGDYTYDRPLGLSDRRLALTAADKAHPPFLTE
jgi:hypothetical protein